MEATAKATFNAPEIKLHFLDYWRIIRIRKTVILAVFLLVVITATLVTFILPESYASMARIKVERDQSDISVISMTRTGTARLSESIMSSDSGSLSRCYADIWNRCSASV